MYNLYFQKEDHMAERHEEKYIIDYRQYAILRSRCMEILTPDPHGHNGSYVISSIYYDDPLDKRIEMIAKCFRAKCPATTAMLDWQKDIVAKFYRGG